MSSIALVAAVALITVGSRAVAVAVLPAPRGTLAAAAALLTVRRRSLLVTVAAGLAGALVGRALA